jgi:hypothetical protein
VIAVQIKTPFNISDLKTSLFIVFTLFAVSLLAYLSSSFLHSKNIISVPGLNSFISFLMIFSFLPGVIYYFNKNKFDLLSSVLILFLLVLFVIVLFLIASLFLFLLSLISRF